MMNPHNHDTIWVVIPVYNAEKWIRKCVRSLQRQTYPHWKAVLVDDGSTDRSGELCDCLARKDNRLIVVHTSNTGASQARINGIKQVTDDSYCMFCDSDDELTPNAMELLHREAIRTDADLVCGGMQRVLKSIPLPKGSDPFIANPKCYGQEEIMRDLILSCLGAGIFPVSLCGKLYRTGSLKNVMTNLEEAPQCFAEDLNVTLHLLPHIECISVVDRVVYRYRYGGGTSRFMPTFLEDNLLMYRIKQRYAHLCTSEWDVAALIAIEMKNIIGSYLVMCEKHQRFSQGSLENEVRFVCDLDEIRDAIGRFQHDKSGIPGLSNAIRAGDNARICQLIRNEVARTRKKDLIKRILMG